jgi:predicted nuclease with TOPRIM domain
MIVGLLAVILGGGFLSGIYMLLKLRPEAGQITVTAAQGAVIVQTGVIDTLKAELERSQSRILALETEQTRMHLLEARIDVLEAERDQLREENMTLRSRVESLEEELILLKKS